MNLQLFLPLLLLGAVAALHLEKDAPHLESRDSQTALSQDMEGSGEPEGELAVTNKVIQPDGEVDSTSEHPDTLEEEEEEEEEEDEEEEEKGLESDSDALDEDLQCPREEDTVKLSGSPGCKTCRYLLVRRPKSFRKAQRICRRCYRGNLISIHNYRVNCRIQSMTSCVNQGRVWIGGRLRGCFLKKFKWTDGSCWNFGYWASGQPRCGRGKCVSMCTNGGRWRRTRCRKRLPFVCSY